MNYYIKTSDYSEIVHDFAAGTINYQRLQEMFTEAPEEGETYNRLLFVGGDGNLSLIIENDQSEAGYDDDFTLVVLSIPCGDFVDSDVIAFENFDTYREALQEMIEISATDHCGE